MNLDPLSTERRDVAVVRALIRLPGLALIGAVRVYQLLLSPLLGRHCRFNPSCSNYFIQAVGKYGAIRGSIKGIARICRCHPWHPGGDDPP
jgi:putative membrane protein insertion efficiency factor